MRSAADKNLHLLVQHIQKTGDESFARLHGILEINHVDIRYVEPYALGVRGLIESYGQNGLVHVYSITYFADDIQ